MEKGSEDEDNEEVMRRMENEIKEEVEIKRREVEWIIKKG